MQQASKHCHVWLFESPRLRGGLGDWQSHFNRALVQSGQPALARWREATGVWHMKLYIFDDTLVISGANLSDTYFTNRQDRYVVFRNARALCDYYSDFLHATCKTPSGFELPDSKNKPFEASQWKTLMSSHNEIGKARRHLDPFMQPAQTSLDPEQTYVFPSFQMAYALYIPFSWFSTWNLLYAVFYQPVQYSSRRRHHGRRAGRAE
jgi:phosphatidylserine/phosphatidylglycerophosphate/cardiolipin synthase-like enzyme